MRAADSWKDYELLDATGGNRLERWGTALLVRPDPQVVWKSEPQSPLWARADAVYHRSHQGGGSWEYRRPLPERWQIHCGEGGGPADADRQPHRLQAHRRVPRAGGELGLVRAQDPGRGPAHPGAEPVRLHRRGHPGLRPRPGASVCHVDASKGMVQWGKENAAASGLAGRPIRWLVDDCAKFVAREKRRGNTYDAIIMDPPSYGRGPGGEVWKLEDCIYDLICQCADVLSPEPLFFAVNSYTAGLSPAVMEYILRTTLVPRFGGSTSCDEIGLPVTATGGVVPCGSTAIWENAK